MIVLIELHLNPMIFFSYFVFTGFVKFSTKEQNKMIKISSLTFNKLLHFHCYCIRFIILVQVLHCLDIIQLSYPIT
ncbi:hypothetical protein BpHYR1_017914 [Brachionus plicatilis]|uniref:Uncharacterized protein n=1 Tax=Brachionus plicatilis TaxID=10195 RepID=A0A3M7SX90_BRAPC|nr:hypothetical protein BpHYR1_017914 [Brachionus plicatilis]